MSERTTTLRCRSIHFKDGRGSISVLRPKRADEIRDEITRSAAKATDRAEMTGEIVGFALVAWARDGRVYVNYRNGDGSGVPAMGLPRYVYDALLTEQATRYARDD